MDIMDAELNGRRADDYQFDNPIVENERFADILALGMLRFEQNDDDVDPRVPPDVLAVVAEVLAGDNDLETLAALNRVCREVHEGTLPVLYETVKLDDERAVERCIKGGVSPKAFKYTKFLWVTDVTLPLIRMHLRRQTEHLPVPSTDLRLLFPRLALVGHSKPVLASRGRRISVPLQLTLYPPLPLPALLRAALPHNSQALTFGVSFFGTYYFDKRQAGKYRVKHNRFRNIVGLTIKTGASLGSIKGAVGMEGWHGNWVDGDIKLEIEDEADAPGVEQTLRLVLDHLAVYASSLQVMVKDQHVRLAIECPASVFKRFTELFKERQPLFLQLEVDITDACDMATMQNYIVDLADAYSLQWRHRPTLSRQLFVEIRANAKVFPSHWLDEEWRAPLTENDTAAYNADLMFGWDGEQPEDDDEMMEVEHNSGFTAQILEVLLHNGRHEHGEVIWQQTHPLAHIPVEEPEAAPTEMDLPLGVRRALIVRLAERQTNGAVGGDAA